MSTAVMDGNEGIDHSEAHHYHFLVWGLVTAFLLPGEKAWSSTCVCPSCNRGRKSQVTYRAWYLAWWPLGPSGVYRWFLFWKTTSNKRNKIKSCFPILQPECIKRTFFFRRKKKESIGICILQCMNHKTLDSHSFLPSPNALQGRFITVTVVRLFLKSHIPGSFSSTLGNLCIQHSEPSVHWKVPMEGGLLDAFTLYRLALSLSYPPMDIPTSSSCFYFTPSSSVPDLNLGGSSFLYIYFTFHIYLFYK